MFFLLLFLFTFIISTEDKLLFVWEHFRHGARGPWISVNMKTNLDFIGERWLGQGELTGSGQRMHYLLGVYMRKRYKNFISDKYNPNEVFFISTNTNRTLTSIQSHLLGFYPNYTNENLTDDKQKFGIIQSMYHLDEDIKKKIQEKIDELNIKNSTVENNYVLPPVNMYHTFLEKQYTVYDAETCPGIKKYLERNQRDYKPILDNISEYTNKTYGEYIYKFMNVSKDDKKYLWNKDNLYYISDTFVADYFDKREMKLIRDTGINMDEFYKDEMNSALSYYYDGDFGTKNFDVPKISMSPVFRSIFNYMDMRINLDKQGKPDIIVKESPRFVIVSGHDTTLGANSIFLKTVFNLPYNFSLYTSSQIYELWKNESGYYIKYIVEGETKAEYEYNSFKGKVESNLFPQEWIEEMCNKVEEEESTIWIILAIIFIIIFIALSFILIWLVKKKE